MYAYKGVQLLYGLFLAYETRAVKLKEINDSRLVALAIYNVVILCMITAPVILVIGNQLNAVNTLKINSFIGNLRRYICFSGLLFRLPFLHFLLLPFNGPCLHAQNYLC